MTSIELVELRWRTVLTQHYAGCREVVQHLGDSTDADLAVGWRSHPPATERLEIRASNVSAAPFALGKIDPSGSLMSMTYSLVSTMEDSCPEKRTSCFQLAADAPRTHLERLRCQRVRSEQCVTARN